MILRGKDPQAGLIVTPRICGICGGSHLYKAAYALDTAWSTSVPHNATPATVINMSLGGPGACLTSTQTAINGARSRGTTVVVAAGNAVQYYTKATCDIDLQKGTTGTDGTSPVTSG